MIKTKDLTKIYNGIRVVDSININVNKGDICGFLGPNGAGKTTTIGMLVGLIEPTRGNCFIDDIDVSKKPIEAKRIKGYLPEDIGFYPNLSGEQNLKYYSKFYNIDNVNKKIIELLSYVGLDKVDKPVGQYSKGMRQRLGVAQALLNDPKVLFLDEPTSGLDPEGVIKFRNIIKDQSKEGKTVFFSSHILSEIQNICNKICIISQGKIIAQGTPNEVKTALCSEDFVTIIFETEEKINKLLNPNIINAQYNGNKAIIYSKIDIRKEIVEEVFANNMHLIEIKIENKPLEEIFLETIYRRD